MARDELYLIHPETRARVAVPRAHFEKVLQPEGWVIDPDGPSAADVAPQTVKAAEKKLDKADAKRAEVAS